MMWDKTLVQFPVQTDVDARIMKDIQRLVINDSRPYSAAANYYLENGKDLKLALEWFDKAITNNPNAYWTIHQKANCQAKMGMKKEAIETANKSMLIAKSDGDDHYVNLNQKLIDSLK
jgi:tetratricopeptide (TPR) repeat protein